MSKDLPPGMKGVCVAERERLARESRWQWVVERELDAAARRMSGAIWYVVVPEREPELAEVLWTVS